MLSWLAYFWYSWKLGSSQPETVRYAASWLADSAHPSSTAALLQALDRLPAVNLPAILIALGRKREPRTLAIVAKYLLNAELAIRQVARATLSSIRADWLQADHTARAIVETALGHMDRQVRFEAAVLIAENRHPESVLLLLPRLLDGDREIRQTAREALQTIRPDWASTPAACISVAKALGHADPQVRLETMQLIHGHRDPQMIALLLPSLIDGDKVVRQATRLTLQAIRTDWLQSEPFARDWVVKALSHADRVLRLEATQLICKQGNASLAPLLLMLLVDEDADIRAAARQILDALVPHWAASDENKRTLAPRLLASLDEADERLQVCTVQLLCHLKILEAVPALVDLLWNESSTLGMAAIEALEQMMPDWRSSDKVRKAIPALVKGLTAADMASRDRSHRVLRIVRAAETIPLLLTQGADKTPEVHEMARGLLSHIAPDWQNSIFATDRLRVFAESTGCELGDGARWLLDILPHRGALDADADLLAKVLRRAHTSRYSELNDGPWQVWQQAFEALRRCVAVEFKAVEELLVHSEALVREAAATAMGQAFLPDAAALVQAIRHDDDPLVQGACIRALAHADNAESAGLLLDLLRNGNGGLGMKEAAVWALGNLRVREAVDPLRDVLCASQIAWSPLRIEAAMALGKIGSAEALTALRHAFSEKIYDVDVLFALYLQLKDKDADFVKSNVSELDRQSFEKRAANPDNNIKAFLQEYNARNRPKRTELEILAHARTIKAFLLNTGLTPDSFLVRLYDRRDAEQLATLWHLGGFWRVR